MTSDIESSDTADRQPVEDELDLNAETDAAHASVDATSDPQPETRDEEMERLRGEVEDANRKALQAQAEAENFRKRMRKSFEDDLKYAGAPMVTDLLQVRDNLMRAIEAAEGTESVQGLRDGVQMVAKQLDDTFAKYAIKEIPAAGEAFDPNFHEAISQMPSDDVESGMVMHVAVSGWQMHDRVLRPAQVIVSSGSAQ
ncbi:nucleotide exchange factor GrpE [Crateriforma conspicua]|nr:nucleotide exchange factor GrpE [Crateriforma conspicua]QDV64021.1 heat shock protein GrpE [Crateriforma conspicua]